MKKRSPGVWYADQLRFTVRGRGAQRFLSAAADQGVKVYSVRCEGDGYSLGASGMDLDRLRRLAAQGNWELSLCSRRGPGAFLERLMDRPGLAVGLVLFLAMVQVMSGFVWHIDFGTLDEAQYPAVRTVLCEQGVLEGVWMTQERLHSAQYMLLQHSDEFGWVSLNFAGGCLFVEQTPNQTQTVEPDTEQQALYAKAGGQVLELRLQSGFAQVAVGQYVAEGQLLANGQKADRDGQAVAQGARGSVLARVQKTYSASCPLERQADVLTGLYAKRDTWYWFGHALAPGEENRQADPFEQSCQTVEWLPLSLGRVSLPGCVRRETFWQTQQQTVLYSQTTAQALVCRQCRLALLADFPDADIQAESVNTLCTQAEVVCEVSYTFTADIAREGALAPLPAE